MCVRVVAEPGLSVTTNPCHFLFCVSSERRSAERKYPGSACHRSGADRLYLLNEKRAAVSAIETRQGGVRCVIVPNDQMETPHYSVLRVRKRQKRQPPSATCCQKLHEEEMAMPSDEESAERKRPEQPALAAFVMPEGSACANGT